METQAPTSTTVRPSARSDLPPRAEVLVIGGGIIGLTLARELALRGRQGVVVLEREATLGRHASGRNSGVLHAGVYYAPGSAKARTCLAGNRLMKAFCREQGLPLRENGKVIVTRTEAELPGLEELQRRASTNGARIEWLDPKELAELEPRARTVGRALLSRDTGVVDPLAVLEGLRRDLAGRGVQLVTGCAFQGLAGPGQARTSLGPIRFTRLVNAAGAWCDQVAEGVGFATPYRLIPFKGIYRKLRPGAEFDVRGSIYPVPDPRNPFLGVHFTRNARGDLYLGPTAIPALGRTNYGLLQGAGRETASILFTDAVLFARNSGFRSVALSEPRKYLPAFFHRDAARLVNGYDPALFGPADKVGIRPQLVDWRTKELVMDFVVEAAGDVVHVLNPISPAFTSSMSIARSVADTHFA